MTVMPRRRRNELADTLRRRVVGSVSSGALRRGDRLPSAREVAADFEADPRLVLAAYRILAREGLVEIRRRSGIYVAGTPSVSDGPPLVAEGWLVDVLVQGVEHGIGAPRLGDFLRRAVTTRRLRAAVVADTADMRDSSCAELRDDYGIDPVPFMPEALDRPGGPAPELLAVDFGFTTEQHAEAMRRALGPAGKPVISVALRNQTPPDWQRALERGMVYMVCTDPRTLQLMHEVMAPEHRDQLTVLVVGRDDLRQIPPSAHVYVTRSAQRRLGEAVIPGKLIATSRAFSAQTARELVRLVVTTNLAALKRA
jgi:hypothetical protein